MEKLLEITLLYDFYGELLTKKQIQIFELYYHNDLSLGEISDECGITRQGVHDTLRRCEKSLYNYEDKLCLVHKFISQKDLVKQILCHTEDMKTLHSSEKFSEKICCIIQIANKILGE